MTPETLALQLSDGPVEVDVARLSTPLAWLSLYRREHAAWAWIVTGRILDDWPAYELAVATCEAYLDHLPRYAPGRRPA